jgi:hypothetical protein
MATIQEHLNAIAGTTGLTEQEAANVLSGESGNTLTTQEAILKWAGLESGTIEEAIRFEAVCNTGEDVQLALDKLSGL